MKSTIKIIFLIPLLISIRLPSFGQNKVNHDPKIQIALLLDVSGSMNGLINQTKAQIWNMLNFISRLEKNNIKPSVQISIGTFGNADSLQNGYFKLFGPLSNDIDFLSETLFSLYTDGQFEYCGHAIQSAIDSLQWSDSEQDLKIIFISGNEMFDQGTRDYRLACECAVEEEIIVNAIYCGEDDMGKLSLWEDAAIRGQGKYSCIQHTNSLNTNETFWDAKIFELNEQLNKTYVPFGKEGIINQRRQLQQDENTLMLGNNYMRERVVFKTGITYDNSNWDLIDALNSDSLFLERIQPFDLPVNLQNKSSKEVYLYLQRKNKEREVYKESIRDYNKISEEFIKVSSDQESIPMTLENSFIMMISEQAEKKGFVLKR